MARRKDIRSAQAFGSALELEKQGRLLESIKGYQKAALIDPLNSRAWNRLMILYRKTKSKPAELKLIKSAIEQYRKAGEERQNQWLKGNSEKADSSRELAQVLGLLEDTGLPRTGDTTIGKWQTRLYLLEYRIRNARKTRMPKKKPAKPTKKSGPA